MSNYDSIDKIRLGGWQAYKHGLKFPEQQCVHEETAALSIIFSV